ncbi:MAG: hypothetical protein J4N97_02795, partial [Chloroflexi bacterium]|nr:hypothetical protein [Chloroflexota bacterium]
GPPAAMKKAFADAQSSKSPQFLSGPNGSNPVSAVAVVVGATDVGDTGGAGDVVGSGVGVGVAVGVGVKVGAGV